MKKVVVVDNDKLLLGALTDLIEFEKDFRAIAFSNPKDALRYILNEKDIYAVVTDYGMPEMNGLELAKEVICNLLTTRTIIISGHDEEYLKKIAFKNKVNLSKIKILCKSDIGKLLDTLKN